MFVVIVRRLIKKNTMSTEKYAPRSTNVEMQFVSGPFLSLRAAQAAVQSALASHTCLAARAFSEAQIREAYGRGEGRNGSDLQSLLRAACETIDAAK